ncbi:MAG: site-specific integrase [Polyangiaceae bacterium]|jgi:integrase
MGRKSTGTVRLMPNAQGREQWHARFTRADGTRTAWIALDPRIPESDEPRAKACAEVEAAQFQHVTRGGIETVASYADRWCKWRERRGLGCIQYDRALLAWHVLPTIGKTDVRTVGRDDIRRLVNVLDAAAQRGWTDQEGKRCPFGWKRAVNAWSVVRAMFRDACGGKDAAIRVRDDNPADGVSGPDVGTRKAKQYLWPYEFMAFVSNEHVPLVWRRLMALAVYAYARAGELAALEWGDVDLEHETIHVHRSLDTRRGQGLKSTKSAVARRVPIEPALVPLLAAMKNNAKSARVIQVPKGHLARPLRLYLEAVGVKRAELFVTDRTRKAVTFHDLRATGITWCAVRGDDALKIKQRAGHASFSTTEGYIREAENLRQGFGGVVPPLPDGLVGSPADEGGAAPDSVIEASVTISGARSSQKQAQSSGGAGNRILRSDNPQLGVTARLFVQVFDFPALPPGPRVLPLPFESSRMLPRRGNSGATHPYTCCQQFCPTARPAGSPGR